MKIDDYSLAKLSNEAENFKEDVSNILNYGKYSAQVVSNTPPSWTARNGEFVFFASGTIKRLYFYNISAWDYIEYNSGATANSVKGWVVYSGTGLTAINASYNVDSVTRNAAGDYTINWTTAFSSSFYPFSASLGGDMTGGVGWAGVFAGSNVTTTSIRVFAKNASGALDDPAIFYLWAGGNL